MGAPHHSGVASSLGFPLSQAIHGRRSRRFASGLSIPSGPLEHASRERPLPLDAMERSMVLAAVAGGTGWHFMIPFNPRYAPFLPNYSGSAKGRTFPSAAGFHTSEIFYTDDTGVYFLPSRDPSPRGVDDAGALGGAEDITMKAIKLADGRLNLPPDDAHLEAHNHWCVNCPGSLLVIPVADLAEHLLLGMCYLLQNGYGIYDDIHRAAVPGLDRFSDLVPPGRLYPLSFLEQQTLAEASVEMGTACFAGSLQLQAMGLGGWEFDGINPFSVLGASGDPEVPGLGFRFDTDPRWALPNPTGLEGRFEGACPPHCRDMREAVDRVAERKFGEGGPFHVRTPGPWKDSPSVRGAAQVHDERFKGCLALMAQHVLDAFGKFPGTVPTMWTHMYLQAHHLDLGFYDAKFGQGAYLSTHAKHMEQWHPKRSQK